MYSHLRLIRWFGAASLALAMCMQLPSSAFAADAAPQLTSVTVYPYPVLVGTQETITAQAKNSGADSPLLVDLEVYNEANAQVAQKFYDNVSIPSGTTGTYTMQWTPSAPGTYVVKVGLFKAGWAGVYEWDDDPFIMTVYSSAPSGDPVFSEHTSVSSNAPAIGDTDTVSATVGNSGSPTTALVDVEVYKDGVAVGQQYFDNVYFDANSTHTFTYAYPVSESGNYTISVGIFSPGWWTLEKWYSETASFTAGSGAGIGTIYHSGLASGWDNWSWGSAVNLSDPAHAVGQTSSIGVSYTQPWGALYLHTAGVNTTAKDALAFSIAGKGSSGQDIHVYLYDANGNTLPPKSLSGYVSGGITDGVWKQVTIPLSDLSAQDRTITGIVFQDASGSAGASVNIGPVTLK